MEKKVVMAVDIGGSKYAVGLVRENGTIICKRRYDWKHISAESVIEEICESMQEMMAANPWEIVHSIGITITGLTDPMTGVWISSCFMDIYELPVGRMIRERFGRPVFIENDCNASAVAERKFGLCKKTDHFVYLTVSNSIGGALFLNGRLYRGGMGFAGEIGNCWVDEELPPGRGNKDKRKRNALENVASGRGLVQTYLKLGGDKKIEGETPDGVGIALLAKEGDLTAKKAFEMEGRYLGQVIATCIMLLNPERVIIGGGVAMSFELFKESLMEVVKNEAKSLRGYFPKIQVTALGYDSGLLGAAAIALCELDC
ncbi:MAG: ROK family protein [Lachnospiraceae bacterium]|nr:ROK family protein [Lachnospiraceae bacterium]